MLAPRVPYPADHGAALRNLPLLQWLGRRHAVSLFAFGDPACEDGRRALAGYTERVEIAPAPSRSRRDRARAAVSGEPDLARRLWSPPLVEALRAEMKRFSFDLVQIEGLEMFELWKAAAVGGPGRRPITIYDAHNAEYALQHRAWEGSRRRGDWASALYSLVQARRLRRYEGACCRAADAVIAVSPEDAASLRPLAAPTRVTVIPNGIDPTYYRTSARSSDGATVLFLGKMDYRPNVDAVTWLASEIWPVVRAALPRARLAIVGRDPTPVVQGLAAVPGVKVIGAVPDERPWFERSDLLVVPMQMGGGVRLKVLQALAMGVPIVATGFGVSGVGARDGEHYLRGDTAPALAQRIVQALGDPDLRQRLALAGRALVCSQFDWSIILPRLDQLYAELTRAPSLAD
jgi:glycosyltransferase involved in cell wall biosynthesis